MRLSNVVLPEPLGPISDTKAPLRTSRSRFARAWLACGPAPYALLTADNRIAASLTAMKLPVGDGPAAWE